MPCEYFTTKKANLIQVFTRRIVYKSSRKLSYKIVQKNNQKLPLKAVKNLYFFYSLFEKLDLKKSGFTSPPSQKHRRWLQQ